MPTTESVTDLDTFFEETCRQMLGRPPTPDEMAVFVLGWYAKMARSRIERHTGKDCFDAAEIRATAVRSGALWRARSAATS